MAAAAADEQFYHRRSDRGPEKDEYNHLPTQDQHLISQLRYAMEGAREKVTKLRDNIDDKDRDISRESALRKAAETRLDQLVDMYGDPNVMEELRDRLPRAGKGDIKEQWSKELDTLKQEASESYSSPGARRSLEREIDDDDDITYRRNKRGGAAGDSDSEDEYGGRRHRSHSPQRGRRGRSRGKGKDDSGYTSFPGQYPGGYPSPPYGGYMPAMYPAYPPPQMMYPSPMQGAQGFIPPQSHSTPMQGQGVPMQGQGVPMQGQGVPMQGQGVPMQGQGVPMQGQGVSYQPMATGYAPQGQVLAGPGAQVPYNPASSPQQMGATAGASDGLATSSVANNLSAAGHGTADRSPQNSSNSTGNLASEEKGGATSQTDPHISREQSRQISLLLAELDASKDLNIKLQDKLTSAEKELGYMKIAAETKDTQIEADLAAKASDVVEEIYRAQKQRDEAMLGRLRIANEERDEALLKLKRRDTTIDEYEMGYGDDSGDFSLKELLSEIEGADSPGQINAQGGRIVDAINSSRQRKRQITTEEMKAVLEERDNAVGKCKKMEGELLRLQRQTRGRTPEKQQMAAIQAKLLATQQERDMALTRIRKLEEELQTLRVYYSLHKSLSQEANLRDQFNNTLENIEGQLKQRDSVVDMAQQENNQLLSQLKQVMAEKEQMSMDLEKAKRAQKEANSNCEKMERLVNVLRRKINGLGSKSDGGETE